MQKISEDSLPIANFRFHIVDVNKIVVLSIFSRNDLMKNLHFLFKMRCLEISWNGLVLTGSTIVTTHQGKPEISYSGNYLENIHSWVHRGPIVSLYYLISTSEDKNYNSPQYHGGFRGLVIHSTDLQTYLVFFREVRLLRVA